MKKLLVFFSIFAVLFVSTIKPINAEYLDDGFSFSSGFTYYFILDEQLLINNYLVAYTPQDVYPATQITFVHNGYNDNVRLIVDSRYSSSSTVVTTTIDLHFVGTIEHYETPNADIYNGYVYSFVWPLSHAINLQYDDYLLAFDTDNPIPPVSIYDTIYSLINKFVFGNNIQSGTHQDLIATLLSSIAVVFVFALPFLLVWKVIKIIMG